MSGRSPGRTRKGSQAGSQTGSQAGSQNGSHAGSQRAPTPGHQRCQLLLYNSLAITLRRASVVPVDQGKQLPYENDFWMYDNGYLLFQGFLEANGRCFWSAPLLEAMRELRFAGYVSPGVLLVCAGACALDVVRAAWARRVLKPPPNYVITSVGDVEDCLVVSVPQGQFTPLPEALCWVILELTSAGQAAVLPAILRALPAAFPSMTRPETSVVYDALAKLSTDRKVYQTSQGYFLMTPESRRRRLHGSPAPSSGQNGVRKRRSMLLSSEEALVLVHGDMHTERAGHLTHQCVQTNLADVICGGNPNDKVLYARSSGCGDGGGGGSGKGGGVLERRHSLRLSSTRRLSASLQRCGSVRALSSHARSEASDSSSAASCSASCGPSCDQPDQQPDKKLSLLARLFRRSGRRGRRGQSAPPAHSPHIRTFSAQFPPAPAEWFNPRVATLTSVATQTQPPPPPAPCPQQPTSSTLPLPRRTGSPAPRPRHSTLGWDPSDRDSLERPSSRASTLPRRHRRRDSLGALSGVSKASKSPLASRSASRSSPSKASATTLSSASTAIHHPDPKALKAAFLSPQHETRCDSPKTSPSNTLISSASSRASTSGMSKASSGYNSSATSRRSNASVSPTRKPLPGDVRRLPSGKAPSPPPSQLPQPVGKNSFTLQVSTTNSSAAVRPPSPKTTPTPASSTTTTTTTTTTINGTNSTKIYVQQQNSPVRSVITFENRSGAKRSLEKEVIVTNGSSTVGEPTSSCPPATSVEKPGAARSKLERPTSLCSPRELIKSGFGGPPTTNGGLKHEPVLETSFDKKKSPSVEALPPCEAERYGNKINNHNLSGKQASSASSFESLTSAGSLMNPSETTVCHVKDVVEMNNSRKLSLTTPAFPVSNKIKESLSYKNILKEVLSAPHDGFLNFRESLKNFSNPPSPTKTLDGLVTSFGGSNGNVHNGGDDKSLVTSASVEKELGDEDSRVPDVCPYSSLGDLSVHFKSIAAQKILSGVSINSVDTLVEVNMAAAEKKNNCGVTIHTDFGMV